MQRTSLRRNLWFEKLEGRCLLATIPAFPGAEGAGGFAAGGRGGDVYHVTTLNNSGAGSFANGIATAPTGGRTIVFDVSGYINLPETLRLTASNVTVAGQTAPGDGIGFKNGTFLVSGDDVVFRHVRFYDDRGGDALNLDSGSNNSIFDHITVAFGNDENFSTWSPPENMTFQYSINAWGLESHSAGGLWNLNNSTAHHTLWSHNHTRNPKARPEDVLDWINNVTFDYDIGFIMGDSATPANWKANVRGSTFISTSPKSTALEKANLDRNGAPNFSLYLNDSALDGNNNGVLDVSAAGYSMASGNYVQSSTPFVNTGVPVTIDDRLSGYKKIVSSAGPLDLAASASRTLRDSLNSLLIDELVNQTKHRVSSASGTGLSNGGFGTLSSAIAPTDTDRDGMPDYWESALGMNTTIANNNGLLPSSGGTLTAGSFFPPATPAGYTNLEEYLHFLAIPHGSVSRSTTTAPTVLDIDLKKFTSGFKNSPVFTLTNISGGTATILADGHTAHFVPTTNYSGRAKFDFKVVDAESSQWTQTFAAIVELAGTPRDLVWKGDGSTNTWDTTSNQWLDDGMLPLTAFGPGDNVTLDNSGSASPAINVVGSQIVSGLTLNSTQNYTLGGTGSLGGTASLRKDGSGSLTIQTANTFSGGTLIEQGTVVLNNATAAGTGKITLKGGTLNVGASINNAIEVAAPSVLISNGTRSLSGDWTGGDALSLGIGSGSTLTATGSMLGLSGNISLGTSNGTFRLYGSLGSPSASFDLGTGSADLINRNGATVELGALAGGTGTTLSGAASFSNPTTYLIGSNNRSTTFAGAIHDGTYAPSTTDTTAITKTGTGTFTLTGISDYTGATIVSTGGLLANGALGSTAVTVNAGATLGGSGQIGGTVAAQNGSILAPGIGLGDADTLTIESGLSLQGNTLVFDLSNSPTGDNDRMVLNSGTLAMTGNNTFRINLKDRALGAGVYILIDGSVSSNLTVVAPMQMLLDIDVPTGSRQTFELQRPTSGSNDPYVRLVVTGDPVSLTWKGNVLANPNDWDLGTTANWMKGALTDTFYNLDAVTFNDTTAIGTVNVVNTVQPRLINVANTATNYVFGGAGSISGTGSIVKTGSGILTIANGNSFTGGTLIDNSSIVLANDTANSTGLGVGPITLSNGTITMYNNFGTYNNSTFDLIVPFGKSGTLNADSRVDIDGSLSGAGTFNLNVPSNGSSGSTSNRTSIHSDGSSFTGTINVTTTDGQGGEFRVGTSYQYPGFPNAAIHLADRVVAAFNGTVNSGAGTIVDIGELSGTTLSSLVGAETGGRNFTWRIGSRNSNATFAGTIAERSTSTVTSLIKTGTGTWSLSGTANYKGGTEIEQGNLSVSGSLTSSGGNFDIANNATLQLNSGTITTDTVSIASGGTLIGCGTINGDVINNGTIIDECTSSSMVITGQLVNNGTIIHRASILGRGVAYGGSTATFGANAIDTSKTALLPGISSSSSNYTNYTRGLNRILVDVANLAGPVSNSDFAFAEWNGISNGGFRATWAIPTITVIPSGGAAGATRIQIAFGDNAIQNTWLRITMLANANTGLASNDVFYFGNAVGDMNVGNVGAPALVVTNEIDTAAVRQNLSPVINSVGIINIYDVNKDGRVNGIDSLIVRQNMRSRGLIRNFTAPVSLRLAPTSRDEQKYSWNLSVPSMIPTDPIGQRILIPASVVSIPNVKLTSVVFKPISNVPIENAPIKNTLFENTLFENTLIENTPIENTPSKKQVVEKLESSTEIPLESNLLKSLDAYFAIARW